MWDPSDKALSHVILTNYSQAGMLRINFIALARLGVSYPTIESKPEPEVNVLTGACLEINKVVKTMLFIFSKWEFQPETLPRANYHLHKARSSARRLTDHVTDTLNTLRC